ncbi:2-hydroxychromene-2-carboxylate isomerase [Methylocystis sp. SC2]|uniref:2-hydroxychromene-2-carboxylate isomerase n=1 Tax=Methylocystis sp. (strain SC2) TaxID=187303 RepID=UPI00027AEB59|nr:2-hydroxychromene-2-carboxylate isomerase [Methylocystis sp. SC2]CCJ06245.1 2-hydroxychromene-2-carboxylate isomerase family protein [Methylocystis sp. SC2]
MAEKLEFWFEFASTYSYVAAEEIEAKAAAARVEVAWRPFLLGPIFAEQGWRDSPFNLYPAKGAYMWRDVERLCQSKGVAWRRPSAFPRNGLLAARVATALDEAEKLAAFVRAVYRANFSDDLDISDPSVLKEILRGLSLDAEPILNRAIDESVKRLLRARTEEAKSRGVFGAPSFFAKEELFWGSDRLEHALEALRE